MRKIIGIICVLFLCGCSVESYDLKSSLEANLPSLAEAVISDRADNNKPLYRYYAEPQIGRRMSTWTGNVFTLNGAEFIMNLDIASILNSRFYKHQNFDKKTDSSAMISMSGTYIDYSNQKNGYTLDIFDFEDGIYFIELDLQYVDFYGYVDYAEIEPVVMSMMKIGKTVDVDLEKVIATYSSKHSTEYVKEKLDLFETVIPDSGRIEELMGISPEEFNNEDGSSEHEAPIEEEVLGDDEGNIAD